MIRPAFVFAALVLVFALAGSPTWAQGSSSQPVIFTYVAEPRAQWADIAKVEVSTKPTMDALVADGTLLGHGTYENRIHSEASPTHGSWFQAESLANIFKALDKIYAQAGATTDLGTITGTNNKRDYVFWTGSPAKRHLVTQGSRAYALNGRPKISLP